MRFLVFINEGGQKDPSAFNANMIFRIQQGEGKSQITFYDKSTRLVSESKEQIIELLTSDKTEIELNTVTIKNEIEFDSI